METLAIFLIIVTVAAVSFGFFVGLGVAASNGAVPADSRFGQMVTARRSVVLSLLITLALWAAVFVAVPGVVARALGVAEGAVYAMGFGAQLIACFVGLLIGQRGWKRGMK